MDAVIPCQVLAPRAHTSVVTQFNHVGLAVRDPARSLAFYRDTIGLIGAVRTEPYGFVISTPTGVSFTLFDGRPPTAVGDLHFGVALPDADAVRQVRERFDSIGLDIHEWSDEPGYTSVKVIDPDGYVVEVAWDEHDVPLPAPS
jgi:catechol 2,3-dioxygenase-like lactoylglutathione lyase family enzyme